MRGPLATRADRLCNQRDGGDMECWKVAIALARRTATRRRKESSGHRGRPREPRGRMRKRRDSCWPSARRRSLHAFAQASRAVHAGQKQQRRSRQRGDAVGLELVAALRREELPGARGRDVCLSGIAAMSPAGLRWQSLSAFWLPTSESQLEISLALGSAVAVAQRQGRAPLSGRQDARRGMRAGQCDRSSAPTDRRSGRSQPSERSPRD
jgi:hypothetical protein